MEKEESPSQLPEPSTHSDTMEEKMEMPASIRGSSASLASVRSLPGGISVLMAAVFITGEIAGSGMLALPYSVSQTGWVGVPLIAILGLASAYCGICLSRSWIIIEGRHPELKTRSQDPYPEIARRALGEPGRIAAALCMCINLYGTSIVFMLIVAQLIQDLLSAYVDFSYCYWVLIIAAVLLPISWLGSPKDLWWIGYLALGTTTLAWVFAMIQLSINYSDVHKSAKYHSPDFLPFFLGVGPILFSFGGASTFPTIQNDMKDRSKFTNSVIFGYMSLITLYVPIAAVGYFGVGDSVQSNILDTLKQVAPGALTSAAQILFIVHLVTAFSVVINPFFQQMEQIFHVPNAFGGRRVVFRTILMALLVFLGELIPDFVKISDLLGSTCIAMMTFIFPPIFYLRLTSMKDPEGKWKKVNVPLWEKTLLVELVVVGTAGGIASTYSAIQSIVEDGLDSSCIIST